MAQQLLSPADIIAQAIDTCWQYTKTITELAVWFAILSLGQWGVNLAARALIPSPANFAYAYVVLSIPVSIVIAALTVMIIDMMAKAVQKKRVEPRSEIAIGFNKVIPFIWVAFLAALAVIGGLFLAIIPAIIFAVWFRFTGYENVVEDTRGVAALKASKKLVAGRFWPVLVRILIITVFFYVVRRFLLSIVYLVIGSALGDPGLFFGNVISIQEQSAFHLLITMVVPQAITALTLPALIAADLILWYDLKRTA